jgi:hypothetical protein
VTRRVLVAGSYPPVPGPVSAAALGAVRRALAAGDDVEVVSPRPSAAHHTATLHGWRAAWALVRRGRAMRADTLVLCVEPGVPFAPGASPRRVRAEATAIAAATRRFRHVEVLAPSGLDADSAAGARLWARAERICVDGDAQRDPTVRHSGVEARRVVVVDPADRRGEIVFAPAAVGVGTGGAADAGAVTPDGPIEWLPGERGAHLAHRAERAVYRAEHTSARLLRKALGRHTAKVGRPVRAAVAPLRRVVMRRARPTKPGAG